jgi:coenzyme F420 hydrogenase subunit beta
MQTNGIETVDLTKVVNGGYCIGCGTCSAVTNSTITIELNAIGKYQANLTQYNAQEHNDIANVCPFANAINNEDTIGKALFSKDANHTDKIGYWLKNYIGYVSEGDFRRNGSSGGLVSWLICELLALGEIDGVLHVLPNSPTPNQTIFFNYGVSTTEENIKQAAKSRYYGVEMSKALDYVKKNPGRYLVVGIPCFIKSIQLLKQQEPVFASRITQTIAILCGHLKSTAYLEFIAYQMAVPVNQIHSFDFRHKIEGNPAKNYAVQIEQNNNGKVTKHVNLMSQFKGEDWGMGLFKYQACDYCDDVMGETADISIGDAWILPYSEETLGNNVVTVRAPKLLTLLEQAITSGRLHFTSVPEQDAIDTQEASFRHRHDGLAYRLELKIKQGEWVPKKRIGPQSQHLNKKYKRIFKLRNNMIALSDKAILHAKQKNDYAFYWPIVSKAVKQYHRCYHPLWIAIPRKMWRLISKFKK